MQRRAIVIPLADLEARAPHRPPGYVDEVISQGQIVGATVHLSPRAHAALVAKYHTIHPAAEWPLWALLAGVWFRQPNDQGVGDTIARELGGGKSEAFKRHHEVVFGVWEKPCACAGQVRTWNALYPYAGGSDGGYFKWPGKGALTGH